MTTHLERVYKLSCELRFEFQNAVNEEGLVFGQFSKTDAALAAIGNWALANLLKESEILEGKTSDDATRKA